jgi:hypothetical protein
MAKNKIIFDDDVDDLAKQLEGGKNATASTNAEKNSKSEEKASNQATPTVTNSQRARAANKKTKEPGTWKRDKNVLYDMESCINRKYVKNGTLTSAQIYKEFVLPLKKFALEKGTGIRDLMNIAIYQFGVKEGIFKALEDDEPK